MRFIAVLLTSFALTVPFFAHAQAKNDSTDRTIRTSSGDVDLDALQNYLSKMYGVDVHVETTWSLGDLFSTLEGAAPLCGWNVVNLRVSFNKKYVGSCHLRLQPADLKARYYAVPSLSCFDGLNLVDTIPHEAIGWAPRQSDTMNIDGILSTLKTSKVELMESYSWDANLINPTPNSLGGNCDIASSQSTVTIDSQSRWVMQHPFDANNPDTVEKLRHVVDLTNLPNLSRVWDGWVGPAIKQGSGFSQWRFENNTLKYRSFASANVDNHGAAYEVRFILGNDLKSIYAIVVLDYFYLWSTHLEDQSEHITKYFTCQVGSPSGFPQWRYGRPNEGFPSQYDKCLYTKQR
jgi:hypothetical protein